MRLRKKQRAILVIVSILLLGGATALVVRALDDSIAFFVSPTTIATEGVEAGRMFRIGGLVVNGSVQPQTDGTVRFDLTDNAHEVTVSYGGILPDLFREGQGIVAQGTMDGGIFLASEVLAKHDETYMPKEVSDALKEAGHWKSEQADEASEEADSDL